MFPVIHWEKMSADEREFFRDMSEETLIARWDSEEGKELKKKIIEINLSRGNSTAYTSFVGTVKTSLGKSPPKIDLRGINFSEFSNLHHDEIFGFDFSNCALHYSDFSNSQFSSSNFRKSDLLYCNFSNSILDRCDFSEANLTLSNFDNSCLEGANFQNAWLSSISLVNADLGYVKFNNKTDFYNIDISKIEGSSNPLFISYIRKKQYLKHFKSKSIGNKIIYYVWLAISDCGQSFIRWSFVSFIICFLFGLLYSMHPEYFIVANERIPTWFTFYYYSIVTFTTLGFGDIVPKNILAEILVTIEVILGYIMLGGLISIFATKFIPKY